MFCHVCGSELKEGAKFCSVCGNPVGPVKAESAPVHKTVQRGNCFGKYAGKEVITVKPARNSMGFVITSMRYYRAGK